MLFIKVKKRKEKKRKKEEYKTASTKNEKKLIAQSNAAV